MLNTWLPFVNFIIDGLGFLGPFLGPLFGGVGQSGSQSSANAECEWNLIKGNSTTQLFSI